MKIDINTQERGFLLNDGQPVKYLRPGVHRPLDWFGTLKVEKVNVSGLLAELDERRLALIPSEDLTIFTVAPSERVVVYQRGRPKLWLGEGTHQLWTVDRTVDRASGTTTGQIRFDRIDVSGVKAPVLQVELAALAKKAGDYLEVTAAEGTVAVRSVDGRLDEVLPAGRHAVWNVLRTSQLAVIDLRERLLAVNGQEVMTKDRVTLRLNLAAVFKVSDPRRLATVAKAPDELVYLALQLASREAVTERTLDELLAAREVLQQVMAPVVRQRAVAVGLELSELGVKDVVLPGEMRELLNKVIQAQKEAEANVILRREETAATRSMAQTAKVLAENPLLVRLKELEAYKDLAAKVGQVHLVLGDGALDKLQLKA